MYDIQNIHDEQSNKSQGKEKGKEEWFIVILEVRLELIQFVQFIDNHVIT